MFRRDVLMLTLYLSVSQRVNNTAEPKPRRACCSCEPVARAHLLTSFVYGICFFVSRQRCLDSFHPRVLIVKTVALCVSNVVALHASRRLNKKGIGVERAQTVQTTATAACSNSNNNNNNAGSHFGSSHIVHSSTFCLSLVVRWCGYLRSWD